MSDVSKLLKLRAEHFDKNTMAIFDEIIPTLEGVRDYLVFVDASYTPGVFYWEEVSEYEGLVMLVGLVRYEPGSSFILDGDMIEITEDNRDYFNRVVNIGIPTEIVNEKDSASVFDFLQKIHTSIVEEESELQRAAEEILTPKFTPPVEEASTEFDLDDLTEEQKSALMIHDTPGKVN